MKKLLSFSLLIFFSLVSANLFAQKTSVIDSLLNVLKTAMEDTNKVKLLNDICFKYFSVNPDTGIKFGMQALELTEKLNWKKGMAVAYNRIGVNYHYKPDHLKALEYYFNALKKFEELQDKKGAGGVYGNIAKTYLVSFNYPKTLEYYFEALKKFEESGDKNLTASILHDISHVYIEQANYSKALEYSFKSLKLHEELGNKNSISSVLNNLGVIYTGLSDYPKAIESYLKALKIFEELGDQRGIARALGNIGGVYDEQKDYPKALEYYDKAKKLNEELKNKNGIARNKNNIGIIYENQKNFTKALEYYSDALGINKELGNKRGMAINLVNLGSVYSKQSDYFSGLEYTFKALEICKELGLKSQTALCLGNIGRFYFSVAKESSKVQLNKLFAGNKVTAMQQAKLYTDSAIIILNEIGEINAAANFYNQLSEIEASLGDNNAALENYKQSVILKDSIFNLEKEKKITQVAMQYEFDKKESAAKAEQEKKEKEIELLSKENEIKTLEVKQKEALLLASRFEAEKKQNEIVLLNTSNEVRELQLTEAERKIAQQLAESKARAAEMEVISKDKQLKEQQLEKQKLVRNGMLIGILLVVVAGVFIFRSLQLRRKLEKQQAVAHERKRISADLHDDVGSTLSSIRIMSTVAENNPQQSAEMVKKISENSKRMLENMGDIVWTENPDHDSFSEMLARMNQFASQTLEPKGIRFKIASGGVSDNIQLASEHRRNFYLIFKEAVNNLAKYSDCTEADIIISGNSKNLSMKISDNGKGFETNNGTSGNGLKNMRRRAENINGDLKISSLAGKGTTIELQMPVT